MSFHSLQDTYDIEENALDWSTIYRTKIGKGSRITNVLDGVFHCLNLHVLNVTKLYAEVE